MYYFHRDTIHIEGVKLGFDRLVFFDRHAVGGEYGAGWKIVGLDFDEKKKSRSWTGLRKQEVEILAWSGLTVGGKKKSRSWTGLRSEEVEIST